MKQPAGTKQPFSWRKYGRYIATGLAFMYAFRILDGFVEKAPFVKRLERANLDSLFSGRNVEVSTDIFLVDVTEDDYRQIFGGVSPLNPARLRDVIQAAMDSGPKVLGIDFDTSGWKDQPPSSLPSQGTPVVWAREAVGSAAAAGSPEAACFGVPEYFPDDDGFIREYSEYVKGGDAAFPTLPLNLVEVFLNGPAACKKALPLKDWKEPKTRPLINYSGDKRAFDRLSAGALLQLKGAPGDAGAAARWDAWKAANPLKGKLVLLGGAYRAARDAYPTPMGYLDGVDILAHTTHSRLPGHELHAEIPRGFLNNWFSIQSYMILLGSFFIPKAWRMGITILTGPVYAFLGNWFWFFTGGTFLSFVPYLVGLVVHQIYEHVMDFRKLEKENHSLQQQLQEMGVKTPAGEA